MQNECDSCALYIYDEEYCDYICEADMARMTMCAL